MEAQGETEPAPPLPVSWATSEDSDNYSERDTEEQLEIDVVPLPSPLEDLEDTSVRVPGMAAQSMADPSMAAFSMAALSMAAPSNLGMPRILTHPHPLWAIQLVPVHPSMMAHPSYVPPPCSWGQAISAAPTFPHASVSQSEHNGVEKPSISS